MKCTLGVTLVIVLSILLTSCFAQTEPDIKGLIYTLDGNTFLVVEDVTLDTSYDEWFDQGKYAISFRITDKTVIREGGKKVPITALKEGQVVEVWATGALAESYPLQGTAKQIVIVDK